MDLHKTGRVFGSYNDKQVYVIAEMILLDISLITAWPMLTGKTLTRFSQLFVSKMKMDYASLTHAEIVYAFSNAAGIESWGAAFSLIMLDKVLMPFMHQRAEVRETIEKQAPAALYSPNQGLLEYKETKEHPRKRKIRQKWANRQTYNKWREMVLFDDISVDYILSYVFDAVIAHAKIRITPHGQRKYYLRAKSLLLGRYSVQMAGMPFKDGLPEKTGQYAEMGAMCEALRGPSKEWTKLPEIKKYAKAFFVIGHYFGECGVLLDRKSQVSEDELLLMSKAGVCPLCQKQFHNMPKHFREDHQQFETAPALDEKWIKETNMEEVAKMYDLTIKRK